MKKQIVAMGDGYGICFPMVPVLEEPLLIMHAIVPYLEPMYIWSAEWEKMSVVTPLKGLSKTWSPY